MTSLRDHVRQYIDGVISTDELTVLDIDLLNEEELEYYYDTYLISDDHQLLYAYSSLFLNLYKEKKKGETLDVKQEHKFFLLMKIMSLREVQVHISNDLISHSNDLKVDEHYVLSRKMFKKFNDIRKKRYKEVVRPFMERLKLTLDQFRNYVPVFEIMLKNAILHNSEMLVRDRYVHKSNRMAKVIVDGWIFTYLEKEYRGDELIMSLINHLRENLRRKYSAAIQKYEEEAKRNLRLERIQMGMK